MLTTGEWEEQYVAVELIGMIDPDKLTLCTVDNTAILGVSSEKMTIVKLGGYAFAGQYDDALGTIVVFEDDEDSNLQRLKYMCHTTKVLKANRVFLKSKKHNEKVESNSNPEHGGGERNDDGEPCECSKEK